jgi:DNA-directed RNA polymerase subunit RPC12/RpoP
VSSAGAMICANEDRHSSAAPAVAVIVYYGQRETLGNYLCAECSACCNCGKQGHVMDKEYWEAYCPHCAARYSGEETVSGPDIVLVDSDRYRQLTEA